MGVLHSNQPLAWCFLRAQVSVTALLHCEHKLDGMQPDSSPLFGCGWRFLLSCCHPSFEKVDVVVFHSTHVGTLGTMILEPWWAFHKFTQAWLVVLIITKICCSTSMIIPYHPIYYGKWKHLNRQPEPARWNRTDSWANVRHQFTAASKFWKAQLAWNEPSMTAGPQIWGKKLGCLVNHHRISPLLINHSFWSFLIISDNFSLFLMISGYCWWFMILEDCWWLLVLVDDSWLLLLMIINHWLVQLLRSNPMITQPTEGSLMLRTAWDPPNPSQHFSMAIATEPKAEPALAPSSCTAAQAMVSSCKSCPQLHFWEEAGWAVYFQWMDKNYSFALTVIVGDCYVTRDMLKRDVMMLVDGLRSDWF